MITAENSNPPTARDSTITTTINENTSRAINVSTLVNDLDLDKAGLGEILEITIATQPNRGNAVVSGGLVTARQGQIRNPTITYTHGRGDVTIEGPFRDTIVYRVTDRGPLNNGTNGRTVTARLIINIAPRNDNNPVAVNHTIPRLPMGVDSVIRVPAGCSDLDQEISNTTTREGRLVTVNNPLRFSRIVAVSHADIRINGQAVPGGGLAITPTNRDITVRVAANSNISLTGAWIDYQITDNDATPTALTSNTARITFTNVIPYTGTPTARTQTITMNEGATRVFPLSEVSNAYVSGSTNWPATTGRIITQPTHGTLTYSAATGFTYVHNGTENHTDSFVFEVQSSNNPLQWSRGTITINLRERNNHAPVVRTLLPTQDVVRNAGNHAGRPAVVVPVIAANDGARTGARITDEDVRTQGTLFIGSIVETRYSTVGFNAASSTTPTAFGTVTPVIASGTNNRSVSISHSGNVPAGSFLYAKIVVAVRDTMLYGETTQNTAFSTTTGNRHMHHSITDTIFVRVTPSNDNPPQLTGIPIYYVPESESFSGNLNGIITDPDGFALTFVQNLNPAVAQPRRGTLAVNSNGTFTYTHNGAGIEVFTDTFTVLVSNTNLALTQSFGITLRIIPRNDEKPQIIGANFREYPITTTGVSVGALNGIRTWVTDEDRYPNFNTTWAYNTTLQSTLRDEFIVSVGGTDVTSERVATGANGGTFRIQPDGSFTYTATGVTLANGRDSIQVRVIDIAPAGLIGGTPPTPLVAGLYGQPSQIGEGSDPIWIKVFASNTNPPVTREFTTVPNWVRENQSNTLNLATLLLPDDRRVVDDPDLDIAGLGERLTISIVTQPTRGNAVAGGVTASVRQGQMINPIITYTHGRNDLTIESPFSDTIVYRVTDAAGASATGSLIVRIEPTNDNPPIAVRVDIPVVYKNIAHFAYPLDDCHDLDQDVSGNLIYLRTPLRITGITNLSSPLVEWEVIRQDALDYVRIFIPGTADITSAWLEYEICDVETGEPVGHSGKARDTIHIHIVGNFPEVPAPNNGNLNVNEGEIRNAMLPASEPSVINGWLADRFRLMHNGIMIDPGTEIRIQHGWVTLNENGTYTYTHDGSEGTFLDHFTYVVKHSGQTENPDEWSPTQGRIDITINPRNNNPPIRTSALDTVVISGNTGTSVTVIAPNDGAHTGARIIDVDWNTQGTLILGNVIATEHVEQNFGTITPIISEDRKSVSITHSGAIPFGEVLNVRIIVEIRDTLLYEQPEDSNIANGHINVRHTILDTIFVRVIPSNDNPPDTSSTPIYYLAENGSILDGDLMTDWIINPDGFPLTFTFIGQTMPRRSDINVNSDGTFTYTHNGRGVEIFTDTFTVSVSSGNHEITFPVIMRILPRNDEKPEVIGEPRRVFPITPTGVSVNALSGITTWVTDEDRYPRFGSTWSYNISGNAWEDYFKVEVAGELVEDEAEFEGANGGTFTIRNDGSFTYTVNGILSGGSDSIQVRVIDFAPAELVSTTPVIPAVSGNYGIPNERGEGSDPIWIVVRVERTNRLPTAGGTTVPISENETIGIDVSELINAPDFDRNPALGEFLTVVLVNESVNGVGEVAPLAPSDRDTDEKRNVIIRYTHGLGNARTESPFTDYIEYRVRDASGRLSDVARITIDIAPTNDNPPVAVLHTIETLRKNSPHIISTPASIGCTDPDEIKASIPTNRLFVTEGTPLRFTRVFHMSEGVEAEVLSDGTIRIFVSANSPVTSGHVYYEITDNDGITNLPDGHSGLAVNRIVIASIDDYTGTPTARNESREVNEGQRVVWTLAEFSNAHDPDGLNWLADNARIVTDAAHGDVMFSAADGGTFTYTHNGSENHADSFVFEVWSSNNPSHWSRGTITIDVNKRNNLAPVVRTLLDTRDIYQNAGNIDGRPALVVPVVADNDGARTGARITDGDVDTEGTLFIGRIVETRYSTTGFDAINFTTTPTSFGTVTPIIVPNSNNRSVSISHEGNIPFGSILYVKVVVEIRDTTLYGQDENTVASLENGNRNMIHTVRDTIFVRVNPSNDNPPVSTSLIYSLPENGTISEDLKERISSPDGFPLEFARFAQATHGFVEVNTNGSFTYTHRGLGIEIFTDTFTVLVSDGTHTRNFEVILRIQPRNDEKPVVKDGEYIRVYEIYADRTLNIPATDGILSWMEDADIYPNFNANWNYADGDYLKDILTIDRATSNNRFVINSDGSFSYTPAPGVLRDSIAVIVKDTSPDGDASEFHEGSDTIWIKVVINELPRAIDNALTVSEGGRDSENLIANDINPLGRWILTATEIIGTPRYGTFTLDNDSVFTYINDRTLLTGTQPFYFDTLRYEMRAVATDGRIVLDTAEIVITIRANAPIVDGIKSFYEDTLAKGIVNKVTIPFDREIDVTRTKFTVEFGGREVHPLRSGGYLLSEDERTVYLMLDTAGRNIATDGLMKVTIEFDERFENTPPAEIFPLDSAAPVVTSARYIRAPGGKDTLILAMSEQSDIAIGGGNAPFKFVRGSDNSLYEILFDDRSLLGVTDGYFMYRMVIASPDSARILAGDSVFVNWEATTVVGDNMGNLQENRENRRVPIDREISASILSATYFSRISPADGYIDLIKVELGTPITLEIAKEVAEALVLSPSRNFTKDIANVTLTEAREGFYLPVRETRREATITSAGTEYRYSNPNTGLFADDSVRILTPVKFDLLTVGGGTRAIDNVAPVVLYAEYILGEGARNNHLNVVFSEPVTATNANPYKFLQQSTNDQYDMVFRGIGAHTTPSPNILQYQVDSTGVPFPLSGDSIWIVLGGVVREGDNIQNYSTVRAPLILSGEYPADFDIFIIPQPLRLMQVGNRQEPVKFCEDFRAFYNIPSHLDKGVAVVLDARGPINPDKQRVVVKILDQTGNAVTDDIEMTFRFTDRGTVSGVAVWNGKNRSGRTVGASSYLALISGEVIFDDGQTKPVGPFKRVIVVSSGH